MRKIYFSFELQAGKGKKPWPELLLKVALLESMLLLKT